MHQNDLQIYKKLSFFPANLMISVTQPYHITLYYLIMMEKYIHNSRRTKFTVLNLTHSYNLYSHNNALLVNVFIC